MMHSLAKTVKHKQKKKPYLKGKIAASIVTIIFSILLFLWYIGSNSSAFPGFLLVLAVADIIVWVFSFGIAKLLGKIPRERLRLSWKYSIAGVAIVVLVALLYWFNIRPSQIRKDCAESLRGKQYSASLANNYYRLCLVRKGIKPESLFVNVGE